MNESTNQRPPSENLVDLHISVVPMDHWVEKLNSASHKVIGDTFSAGFIRVLPDTSVARLRRDIKEQLGNEIFPEDYVFLKHVGRCLALVRQTQERQLKVKNFLPPYSTMPEIFVLPGQPTMYTYAVLPPIQPRLQDLHNSVSDLSSITANGTAVGASQLPPVQSSYKFDNVNDSLSPSYNNSPTLRNDGPVPLPQTIKATGANKLVQNGKHLNTRIPSSTRKREMKRQQRHVSGKSAYENEADPSKSQSTFSSEHRRQKTPRQSIDDVPTDYSHQRVEAAHTYTNSSHIMQEERRPSHAKSVLRDGPKKRRVRYNMPPQSNASSRDNDMNDDTNTLSSHDPQHGMDPRYLTNHNPSLDSSPDDLPLQYKENENPSYPHNVPVNYNGRMRKQFIDTSSHAIVSMSNGTHQTWHASNSARFELEHENSSPSPNLHPVHAMHVSQPEPRPFYNPESKALVDPTTGEKWNIEAVTSRRGDLVKSASANDDSGFVEHELSDSDESYKAINKRQSLRNSIDANPIQIQVQPESDVPTVEEHLVRQSYRDQHATLNFDNHSLCSSPQSLGGEERDFEEPRPHSSLGEPFVVNSKDVEDTSHIQSVAAASKEEGLRSSSLLKSEVENHSSRDSLQVRSENHNETEATQEPETRQFSPNLTHHSDFYESSVPAGAANQHVPLHRNGDVDIENQDRDEGSSQHEEGSRLSFRLSQQGYRIRSEIMDETGNRKFEMQLDGGAATENTLHHEQEDEYDRESHQHSHDNEEEHSDDGDGYESSIDEFQQELANITARQLGGTHEQLIQPNIPSQSTTNENLKKNTQEELSSVSPLDETMLSFAHGKEDINQRSFSPAGQEIPKRESISGSSEVTAAVKSPLKPITNIISFATTDSFHPNDMTRDGAIVDPTIQKILNESIAVEGGQSRGAPDGMPMQRKVDTSGTDKPDKNIAESMSSLHLADKSNGISHTDILTLVDDQESAPVTSTSRDKKDQPGEVISPGNELPSATTETISTSQPIPSEHQHEIVKPSEEESSPATSSESHSPQFVKSDLKPDDSKSPNTSDTERHNQTSASDETKVNSPEAAATATKKLGSTERAKLWDQLQKVREERQKVEKNRQDLVKHAKITTSKTNHKRSTVRDMWKKKFFEEKKRTLPLEDICRRLQAEVDSSHRQLVSAMEGMKPGGDLKKFVPILPPVVHPPSNKNNNTILATRLQHDMDNLRRRIEDAKIKLTGEIKLRHQAEQDVKAMRQELLAKKIQAHVAYREISRAHPFSVKMNT